MKSSNIRYVPGLDHLRAGAVLLVVFYHALHLLSLIPRAVSKGVEFHALWVYSKNPLVSLIEEGHSSVGLFMVLSGFVFSVGAVGREIEYWPFLKNRFLRIYPLMVVLAMVGAAAHPARYAFLGLLQTLLFQADFQGALSADPFSSVFWTIAVEFQFYLVFPFLHRFIERDGFRLGFALILLANLLRVGAVYVGSSNPHDVYYWHMVGRLDEFVLGMLAARIHLRIKERRLPWGPLSLGAVALVLGALLAYNQLGGWSSAGRWKIVWPTIEGVVWAALIIAYVPFANRVPEWLSRPVARLGTWSYSLYLLHFGFLLLLPRFIPFYPGSRPNLSSQLYALEWVLPVLIPLAALSYYAVERPFLELRVRYLRAPDAP